jgi:hypothetical protein
MSNSSQLQRERELGIAEEEDNIVNLTINENFPILRSTKSSLKRGILDFLAVSDGEEQSLTLQTGPSSFDADDSPNM